MPGWVYVSCFPLPFCIESWGEEHVWSKRKWVESAESLSEAHGLHSRRPEWGRFSCAMGTICGPAMSKPFHEGKASWVEGRSLFSWPLPRAQNWPHWQSKTKLPQVQGLDGGTRGPFGWCFMTPRHSKWNYTKSLKKAKKEIKGDTHHTIPILGLIPRPLFCYHDKLIFW